MPKSLARKVVDFGSDHWRQILVGSAVILIGGSAYYYYSSLNQTDKNLLKKSKKQQKKQKKSDILKKDVVIDIVNDQKAPIVESFEPEPVVDQKLVSVIQAKGNALFGEKKFKEAIKEYSDAINLAPSNAIYFNNRAACYAHLKEYENVVADCTTDPLYEKALNRRAAAYEVQKDYYNSLEDYSALCILEEFKNQNSMNNADKQLKVIGTIKAAEMMKTRIHKLPSDAFITAYMESFRKTSTHIDENIVMVPDTESDATLVEAFKYVKERKYDLVVENCKKSIKMGELSTSFDTMAYTLNGTFEFLTGNINGALENFDKAIEIDPKNVEAHIKRSAVYMEKGEIENAAKTFETILQISPQDPDIFYHRGQIRHLTGDLPGAIADFTEAITLDKELVYAHIQLGVAQYKNGDVGRATQTFRRAEKAFPERSEVFNYQGEVYLDQADDAKAMECFERCIKLQPDSSLPYINKAMLYLQVRNDPILAEENFKKAIEVDPTGDIVYGPLAQLYLTQNRLDEAVAIYEKAIEVARTEQELISAICCKEAALVQMAVSKRYPEVMEKILANQPQSY